MLWKLKSASGHQTPCTVKSLLCIGCAATEETTAASAAELKRSRSRDSALRSFLTPAADSTLSMPPTPEGR